MKRAVYAGTFDPPTNGHGWMITEASKLFDELMVAIAVNPDKKTTFTAAERERMMTDMVAALPNVRVTTVGTGYLVDYASSIEAGHVVRGIRSAQDYEYEHGMCQENSEINADVTTVFLMPPRELAGVSSSLVKNLIGPAGWERAVSRKVSPSVLKRLIAKHHTLWKHCVERGAAGDEDAFWDAVLTPYFESHRFYHNWQHPCDLMVEFDRVRDSIEDPLRVELDIWLHDIVYDPCRNDNEERSAEFARKLIHDIGLPDSLGEKVVSDIIATKTHHATDRDALLFLDMDTSILGKPEKVFDRYEEGVRREYVESGRATDEEFKEGRRGFLEIYLETHDPIYATEEFRSIYEEPARRNINRSIADLKQ